MNTQIEPQGPALVTCLQGGRVGLWGGGGGDDCKKPHPASLSGLFDPIRRDFFYLFFLLEGAEVALNCVGLKTERLQKGGEGWGGGGSQEQNCQSELLHSYTPTLPVWTGGGGAAERLIWWDGLRDGWKRRCEGWSSIQTQCNGAAL